MSTKNIVADICLFGNDIIGFGAISNRTGSKNVIDCGFFAGPGNRDHMAHATVGDAIASAIRALRMHGLQNGTASVTIRRTLPKEQTTTTIDLSINPDAVSPISDSMRFD